MSKSGRNFLIAFNDVLWQNQTVFGALEFKRVAESWILYYVWACMLRYFRVFTQSLDFGRFYLLFARVGDVML